MMQIIVEISTYIFISILLGYFFGWLITKIVLESRYQDKLNEVISKTSMNTQELNSVKDKLFEYKKENKILKAQNKKASLGYEGQKYVLDEHNATLDEFQKRLLSKDEVIETLTSKLSLVEEENIKIEKKHEEEIDAFMFERIEITQKYKNLSKKLNLLKQHKGMLREKGSWFSKLFSSSRSVIH